MKPGSSPTVAHCEHFNEFTAEGYGCARPRVDGSRRDGGTGIWRALLASMVQRARIRLENAVGSITERTRMWVFLTLVWGFAPGSLLFGVVGVADEAHHTWGTSLAWGLIACVVLGGPVALWVLRRTGYPDRRPAALARAVGAAIALDVFIACFGIALMGIFYPRCGCS